MGNERTLKMIAAASAKLKRIDPDFAGNVSASRKKARRETARERLLHLHREYAKDFKRYVVKSNVQIDADIEESVGDLHSQDDLLFDLAGSDHGRPDQPLIVDNTARRYTHNGVTLTLAEWSLKTGLKASSIYYRISNGYTIEEALTRSDNGSERRRRQVKVVGPTMSTSRKPKLYTHDSQTMTLAEWSKITGIPQRTLYGRLTAGFTLEEALASKRKERSARRYDHNGQSKTLAEWSQLSGIGLNTIVSRLRNGMTISDAVSRCISNKSRNISNRNHGVWVGTLENTSAKDRPHSLDIQPKQEIFQ